MRVFVDMFKSSITLCKETQCLGTEHRLNSVYKARYRFIRQLINIGMRLLPINFGCLSKLYADI